MKKTIFFILIFLLFLPEFQRNLNIWELAKLNGAFYPIEKPSMFSDNWLDGKYQHKYNAYFEENIGFRNWLVRLNNQLKFSLFNKTIPTLTIGENKVLYETSYINAYLGKDYKNGSQLKEKVGKLEIIQRELKKHGIEFVFLIAPNKVSYMPEYLPESIQKKSNDTTNYEIIVNEMKKRKINLIDMSEWFRKMKNTVSYPLFPKNGIHWSGYGVSFAADSLFSYLEKKLGVNLVNILTEPGEITATNMKSTDNDLEVLANLIFPLENDTMYYPAISFKTDSTTRKINALIIGDSFMKMFTNMYPYFLNMLDIESEFWWYYRRVELPDLKNGTLINTLNLKEEIINRDVLLLEATEENLNELGFGFIEEMFLLLESGDMNEGWKKLLLIRQIIQRIINNPEWLEKVKQQAREKNITVNDMIFRNAKYFIENKN